MKLDLSPQRCDEELEVFIADDVLIINGIEIDFSQIPDGAVLPFSAIKCQFIAGDVKRVDGILHVPLVLSIRSDASEAARFPGPIFVSSNGPVELPR